MWRTQIGGKYHRDDDSVFRLKARLVKLGVSVSHPIADEIQLSTVDQGFAFDLHSLRYESESFLPAALHASKPSVFFVVGNPAPDSVAQASMYAYEGTGGRQHRFWKVLHAGGPDPG